MGNLIKRISARHGLVTDVTVGPVNLAADVTGILPASEVKGLTFTAQNQDRPIVAGTPVATYTPTGSGFWTTSSGYGFLPIIGFTTVDSVAGQAIPIQFTGVITRSDWTPITGTVTLARGFYYSGLLHYMTANPLTDGSIVMQCLGFAVAPDTFAIEIQPSILF